MSSAVGNTGYVLLKMAHRLRLQRHGKGNWRGIEMKPSSSVLLAISVTVLLMVVFEVASAQETGPNRGVQREPVSPAARVPEGGGPATSQPGRADGTGNPVLGRDRRPLYRFNKSDMLEISFAFAPEFNQTATVQPDGYITLRDAGHLIAEGLTAEELEVAIATAYSKLLHDPHITVGLKDFDRPYFIAAGEVGRPGKYELRGPMTISAAVAIAGGFTEQAKHSQVVLFRRVSTNLVETRVLNVKEMLKHRNLDEDPPLQAGDYVFVPRNTISKIMRFMPATSMGMYSTSARF
jgi:polysaccharide export outer membrane protein